MPTPHQTYVTPIRTTPQHNTYLYYHSPPHQLIYITTHTSNQPIPMAYGISLSEEQQTHPIYTALRAAIEQGTTAPSKSIEVNICTNTPSAHSLNKGKALRALLYRKRNSSSSSPPDFLFTYGQRIWTRIRIYYGNWIHIRSRNIILEPMVKRN